ncbi:hypothetical protein HG531_011071 [Fusarium graminearum]|nr:hypothetical protein HG531_011071 [Fusarium graminearum]
MQGIITAHLSDEILVYLAYHRENRFLHIVQTDEFLELLPGRALVRTKRGSVAQEVILCDQVILQIITGLSGLYETFKLSSAGFEECLFDRPNVAKGLVISIRRDSSDQNLDIEAVIATLDFHPIFEPFPHHAMENHSQLVGSVVRQF